MINLETCKFVVFGFRKEYNTFRHIHEAFYRALNHKFPGRAFWVDKLAADQAENTFFISVDIADWKNIPRHTDAFYAIHNVNPAIKQWFSGHKLMSYGVLNTTTDLKGYEEVAPEIFFTPQPWEPYTTVQFRWGTDLLPHEIEANKPSRVFNAESKVINYVGSKCGEYDTYQKPFGQVCWENGILFRHIGGYGTGVTPVSVEENVRLIKQSYMAPTLAIPSQMVSGYAPCRIFKNISYGQFGVTNSHYVNELFGNRLICNPDPRQLFFDAKERLSSMPLSELHSLMDEVAQKHTYLNKIEGMLEAAKRTID